MALLKLVLMLGAFTYHLVRFRWACLRLRSKRKLLRALMEMPTLTPSQLADTIRSKQTKKTLMLCKGVISAPEPCYSILDSAKKVVFSAVFGPTKNFATLSQNMLNYKEASYMRLSDSGVSLDILEGHRSRYCPKEFTEIKGDDTFLEILRRAFRRFFYKEINSNFESVDYSTFATTPLKEYYIPDGSEAVILGEFSPLTSGGISCISPKFVSTSK